MKQLMPLFIFAIIAGPGIGYSKLYLFHIALMIILSTFLLSTLKTNKIHIENINNKWIIFFVFLLSWNVFSLLWSIEKSYTFQYLFYLINGILLILTINYYTYTTEELLKVVEVALFTIALQILVSLLEIFTSFRYPLSPYSPYSGIFGRSGFDSSSLSTIAINYIGTTPTGFMGSNPNNLATALNLFLPFFLFMKNKKRAIILVALLVLVIIYTGSRGNLIASAGMILLYFISFNIKRFMRFFMVLPVLLVFVWIAIKNLSNSTNMKLQELLSVPQALMKFLAFDSIDNQDSIGIRQSVIVNGLRALKESYYLGVGGGASNKVQELNGSAVTSMHNFWVELLVEGGVLLFLGFVWWYIFVVSKLYKLYMKSFIDPQLRKIAGATCLSLIGFIPGAISASSTIYLLPMWLIFAIAICIINISNKQQRRQMI